jgi:hypothetical protein
VDAGLKRNIGGPIFPTADVRSGSSDERQWQQPSWPAKASTAILLSAILLSSCFSPPVSECVFSKPILVSRADVLTPGTAGQIVAHNRKWQEFCGAG